MRTTFGILAIGLIALVLISLSNNQNKDKTIHHEYHHSKQNLKSISANAGGGDETNEQNFEIIKDLSPTHETDNFQQLKIHKIIPFDFSNDNYLIRPMSIASDDDGNVFLFDGKLYSVYCFNSSGEFKFSFSGKGSGPGEMGIGSMGTFDQRKLNYVKNIGILVNGFQNKWINVFDPNTGKRKYEIPLPDSKLFYPVMDSQNNLYKLSSDNDQGVVQILDRNSQIKATLLDSKELRRFFEFPYIRPWKIETLATPANDSVYYDLLSDNRFIIFLQVPSMVYIFQNQKLIDQYPVRPKKALLEREERIQARARIKETKQYKAMLKKMPDLENRTLRYRKIFRGMFVDKDSRNKYYLTSYRAIDGKQNPIFVFTVNDELLEILYFNPPGEKKEFAIFGEKKNGLFYSIGEKSIYICKR